MTLILNTIFQAGPIFPTFNALTILFSSLKMPFITTFSLRNVIYPIKYEKIFSDTYLPACILRISSYIRTLVKSA